MTDVAWNRLVSRLVKEKEEVGYEVDTRDDDDKNEGLRLLSSKLRIINERFQEKDRELRQKEYVIDLDMVSRSSWSYFYFLPSRFPTTTRFYALLYSDVNTAAHQ